MKCSDEVAMECYIGPQLASSGAQQLHGWGVGLGLGLGDTRTGLES